MTHQHVEFGVTDVINYLDDLADQLPDVALIRAPECGGYPYVIDLDKCLIYLADRLRGDQWVAAALEALDVLRDHHLRPRLGLIHGGRSPDRRAGPAARVRRAGKVGATVRKLPRTP